MTCSLQIKPYWSKALHFVEKYNLSGKTVWYLWSWHRLSTNNNPWHWGRACFKCRVCLPIEVASVWVLRVPIGPASKVNFDFVAPATWVALWWEGTYSNHIESNEGAGVWRPPSRRGPCLPGDYCARRTGLKISLHVRPPYSGAPTRRQRLSP